MSVTRRRSPLVRTRLVGMLTTALVVGLATAGTASGAPEPAAAAGPGLSVGVEVAVARARPGNVQLEPAVAWNGSVYLVVWTEITPFVEGSSIYGARVSRTGTVLDPGGILLSPTEALSNRNPRVAAGNGRFLVVWEEDRSPTDIRGALVDGAGTVLKQWFVSIGEDYQLTPDVAWNGTQFFVVWSDQVDGEPFDIYGTRVRWSGWTLDGCNSDVCDEFSHGLPVNASAPGDQYQPAIAAITSGPNAGLLQVTWTDQVDPADHELRGGRLTNDGVSLDGTGFLVSGAAGTQSYPALATNGGTMLGAWMDERRGPSSDVFGARLRPTLAPGTTPAPLPSQGFAISKAAGEQGDAAVAPRADGFLTVWTDTRTGGFDVMAARIGPAGANLDPAGVKVAASARVEAEPAVAASSTSVLVSYDRDTVGPPFEGRTRVFLRMVH